MTHNDDARQAGSAMVVAMSSEPQNMILEIEQPYDEEDGERLIDLPHGSASACMSRSNSSSSFPPLSPLVFSPRCGCFEESTQPIPPPVLSLLLSSASSSSSSSPAFSPSLRLPIPSCHSMCTDLHLVLPPRPSSPSPSASSAEPVPNASISRSSSSTSLTAPLMLLPPEIVHHVLGFLDVASLASCYRVCQSWRAHLQSAALWRGAYLSLWTRSDAALHRAEAAENHSFQQRVLHRRNEAMHQPPAIVLVPPAIAVKEMQQDATSEANLKCPAVVQSESVGGDDDQTEQLQHSGSEDVGIGAWESEYDNESWRRTMGWLQRRRRTRVVRDVQSPVLGEDKQAHDAVVFMKEPAATKPSPQQEKQSDEDSLNDSMCLSDDVGHMSKPTTKQNYWMKMSLERYIVDTRSAWAVSCYQPPSSTPLFSPASSPSPGGLSLSSSPSSFSLVPHSPGTRLTPPSSYSSSSPILGASQRRSSLSVSPLSTSPMPTTEMLSRSPGIDYSSPSRSLSISPRSPSAHASSIVYGTETDKRKQAEPSEAKRDPGNRWTTNPSCCYQLNAPVTRVWSLHMHGDGQTLFAGSEDHKIRQWDVCRGKCLRKFQGHAGLVWDVKTTDTDLISASEDLAIKVWDIETRRCTKTLLGHTEWVSCLYIKDDLLISGSFDNTFKVWSNWQSKHAGVKAKCTTYHTAHDDNIWCMAGSNTTLASGAKDCFVKLWDIGTMKHISTLKGHRGWVSKLQIDDSKVISGSRDETLRIWDLKSLQCVHTLEIPSAALSTKSQGSGGRCDLAHPIWGMQFDDYKLISAGGGGLVCLWDLRTMGCYHVIEHDPPFAIRSLAFDQTKLVHGGFSASHSAYMYIYFDIY